NWYQRRLGVVGVIPSSYGRILMGGRVSRGQRSANLPCDSRTPARKHRKDSASLLSRLTPPAFHFKLGSDSYVVFRQRFPERFRQFDLFATRSLRFGDAQLERFDPVLKHANVVLSRHAPLILPDRAPNQDRDDHRPQQGSGAELEPKTSRL